MKSAERATEKTCWSCRQDMTSNTGTNLFRGMVDLMTIPMRMFGEIAGFMTNSASPFTAGERLPSGRYETRPSTVSASNVEYPLIAQGPLETVLAFTTDEQIFLKGLPDNPYFSSHGVLVDFQHNRLPGMFSRLSFPIGNVDVADANLWPPVQPEPFDEPTLFEVHADKHGFSKQAYFFDGGESSLVTVGPSLPKIVRLKGGGAQFWVASNGVITQGTGKYKGVRGISAYNGSSIFPTWPENESEQFEILSNGFNALVSAYFKLVSQANIDEQFNPTLVQSWQKITGK
ncbi:MAG TPA: hypothetical protein VLB46_22725 [Pyrinomonadaceae bacterium]|nr:hypothetical protein [Pyrinomonadaceae bacterium]